MEELQTVGGYVGERKSEELAMHLLVRYTLIRYATPTDVKSLLKC